MATSIESLADELRQAADDEAQLRNRLEAVVAGMGEALIAVDGNGRVTTFNRAAEELVGKPATAALGRPIDKVVKLRAEDGQDVSARLRRPSATPWNETGHVTQRGGVEVRRDTCEPYFYEPGVTKAPECQNYLNSMKQYATDASIDSLEDVSHSARPDSTGSPPGAKTR